MPEIRPYHRISGAHTVLTPDGSIIPEGVNITSALRAGDKHREAALAHIVTCYYGGYLSAEEYAARSAAAHAAVIQRHLADLTADLPPCDQAARQPAAWRRRWRRALPLRIAASYAGALMALLVPYTATGWATHTGRLGSSLLIAGTIVACVWLLGTLVWMCCIAYGSDSRTGS
jgi:hypothetical protein